MEIDVQSTSVEERDTFNLLSDQGVMKFEVTLAEASAGTVTVEYRTRQGTAAENDDFDRRFDPVSGTLEFAPGETVKTVEIATMVDDLDETDEFFELELFDPTGGATLAGDGPTVRATGWILDNDGSTDDRAFRISDPVVLEGDSGTTTALFEAELSRPSDATIQVPWATASNTARAGEDFTEANGTFTFAPGQTRAVAFVDVLGDAVVEPTETFFLIGDTSGVSAIHSGSDGTVGTATIIDDDAGPRTISINDAWSRERDTSDLLSDQGMQRFVVTLSEPSTGTVSVDYRAVPGTAQADDFGRFQPATEGTLTFEAGQTTAWINIRTTRDDDDEVDEALQMILSDPVGAVLAGGTPQLTAVGWILDDDGAPEDRAIYVPDVTVPEGDSGTAPAVFELRLSRPSETAIEVGYNTADLTARAGSDYVATSGTLTFEPGQTSATVFVPVIGNTEVGSSSKEFLLNFAPDTSQVFSGVGFSATGTILEDDVPNSPPTGSVVIVGDAIEGQILTADASTLDDANGLGTLSFQWLRDDTAISGATSSNYEATAADVGNTLQVRVSYTDGDGYSESLTSAATEPVAGLDVDVTLSGQVSDSQGRAMDDVMLSLQVEGSPDQTANSDASGAFDFTLAEGTGGRLEATHPHDPARDPDITSDDALNVLRLAVGIDPSFGPATPQNHIAADFDGNGSVTPGDALEILRTAIGLESDLAPRWVFLDAETDWDNVVQDDGSIAYEEGIAFAPVSGALDLAMTGILIGNIEAA